MKLMLNCDEIDGPRRAGYVSRGSHLICGFVGAPTKTTANWTAWTAKPVGTMNHLFHRLNICFIGDQHLFHRWISICFIGG